MSTSRRNFALKTNAAFLFLPNYCNVTECDSRIPQNRLPSEAQKLMHRAFLYFYEKGLNNNLLGQHKSVNWTSVKSTLGLIKEVAYIPSTVSSNRLPSEAQKLMHRAFLYFYEKGLNNNLLGQHKSVNWTSVKSTLGLIKEVAYIPSTVSSNRLPSEAQKLMHRAFLYFYEKGLNNNLLVQHKSVNWTSAKSTLGLIKEVAYIPSTVPSNRLPSEAQKLMHRAFLYFYEKGLNNNLLGQHKSVNWTSAKSTLGLIEEAPIYQALFPPTVCNQKSKN